jgi:hypothetical protein
LQHEYATILYRNKNDGKIYRTTAKSSDPISHNSVDIRSMFTGLANDQIPLAVLHNHPAVPSKYPQDINNYLSDADSKLGKNGASLQRGPTGPLQMFLIPPNGPLSEGTGVQKDVSYYNKETRMTDKALNLQPTQRTLGAIPIDEMKIQWAKKIMQNQIMPVEMKQKILANLIPGYGAQAQVQP